jgi:hypothetical protein
MSNEQAAPTRIAGMGIGTFAVFISTIIWIIFFAITSPLSHTIKWFWRFIVSLCWGIVFILLVYAEKEPEYTYPLEGPTLKVAHPRS